MPLLYGMIIFSIIWSIFLVFDLVCYVLSFHSTYEKWYYYLPGGGVASLVIFGLNNSSHRNKPKI